MKLSVIVPCYRVAAYLPACLDSVCALPPDCVEILCVDDASPDESGAILADYTARYPQIRVLHHAINRGLSAARNTGLEQAQGEYVLFLDSDDLLCADAALQLAQQAIDNRLDILQAAYVRFADGSDEELPSPLMARATSVLSGDACFADQCAARRFEPMTVIRLYRRTFLQENALHMAEGFLFEDELFTAPAFLKAARAQVSDVLLYRYRQRDGGIMGSFVASAGWCEHYLRIAERLTALCAGSPPTPGQRALRMRAAAIALNIPRNIVAHGLSGAILHEARTFVRAHAHEIAVFAAQSGSLSLRLQGTLLHLSPAAYMGLYGLLRRMRR